MKNTASLPRFQRGTYIRSHSRSTKGVCRSGISSRSCVARCDYRIKMRATILIPRMIWKEHLGAVASLSGSCRGHRCGRSKADTPMLTKNKGHHTLDQVIQSAMALLTLNVFVSAWHGMAKEHSLKEKKSAWSYASALANSDDLAAAALRIPPKRSRSYSL